MSLLQSGQYEEASSIFRKALLVKPENVNARIQLAGLLFETNEIGESIELFQGITDKHPELIEGWLGLGKAMESSGDFAAASNALRRAQSLGPDYGDVHYALASVLRKR